MTVNIVAYLPSTYLKYYFVLANSRESRRRVHKHMTLTARVSYGIGHSATEALPPDCDMCEQSGLLVAFSIRSGST